MNDTYHYEEGAIHNDNKRVLQIENVGANDAEKLLHAFFQEAAVDANCVEEANASLHESRQAILDELLALVDKGDWAKGVSAEAIKRMLTTVLGTDDSVLTEEEREMSKDLWGMFEHGRGDRVKIMCENLIGYFAEKKLFALNDTPALSILFFGNKESINNINKGKNGRLSKVAPLLDAHLPKKG